MKQVVQPLSGGPVRIVEVPPPSVSPTEVLVRTTVSLVSPGTEGAATSFARTSLRSKARGRPDLVRNVVAKARRDGVASAYRTVRTRLDQDLPLGYSAAGIAMEVGEHVADIRPGGRVATGGAGKANHAELQAVPGLLCSPVAEGVSDEDAAFATVGSIAMHALRLGQIEPGMSVVVVGLGLIGQLALRLAHASGCPVAGIDVDAFPVERARAASFEAFIEQGQTTTDAILEWTDGPGADVVVVAAGGRTSGPLVRSVELCRDRATIVVLGDVDVDLERRTLYERELTLRFARSYGPGRYERSYEEWGVDMPVGQVRWTEGRNQGAVLQMLAESKLVVSDLVTHRFAIDDAPAAYELIEKGSEPYLGIQLLYPDESPSTTAFQLRPARRDSDLRLGVIGTGDFSRGVLVPAFQKAGFELVAASSASGLSARRAGQRSDFERISTTEDILVASDINVVCISTPHENHASLIVESLQAGKHVFCEKPLALSAEELDRVISEWSGSGSILFAGFNRRWSEAVRIVRERLGSRPHPLVINYRVNAGVVPDDHWYGDRRQGGRLIGEVCHFVDTCAALVGTDASVVQAVGSGTGERQLVEDLGILLGYPDGSVATITYSSGGSPAVEKERIGVSGGGHSATIVDFKKLRVDGDSVKGARLDKGHQNEIQAFSHAIRNGDREITLSLIGSMRTTLEAVANLLSH